MEKNAYDEMFAVEDKHWWYVGLHDLVILLSNTLFPQRSLKILDVGCGTGGLLSVFNQAGYETEGLDYSEDALEYCHKRGLSNVFKADINDWVPKPNSYDLITAFDVLSHEWVRDEIQVLKSLRNGLKDGGLIMLNYPAFPILRRKHDQVVMMSRRYTKKSLNKNLEEAGLVPVLYSYRLPHAYFSLLALRFFEAFKPKKQNAKSDIASIPAEFVNIALIKANKLENRAIAQGFSIPFGSSLFVVSKKTA
jgi:SAM-dependent methyltransferase